MGTHTFGFQRVLLVGGTNAGTFMSVLSGQGVVRMEQKDERTVRLGTHVLQREQSREATFTYEEYVATDHGIPGATIFVLRGMPGADIPREMLKIISRLDSKIGELNSALELERIAQQNVAFYVKGD
ncbi:hypothetical protein KF4_007 [Vibrio phage vB_VpaS_KF4]|nr:hypothetical protein KF3_070 [Vibrio phage vB_VpaS_KF3]ATI19220.1 hypothetical protein KF4_007 [Vibrio phage vB_VpaS_KF4]